MLGHFWKVAVRNIIAHKGYFLINVCGLAIGIACCVLIILWVVSEFGYDRHHENADRIYRIRVSADISGTGFTAPRSNIPAPQIMANEYPEVEYACLLRTCNLAHSVIRSSHKPKAAAMLGARRS